MGTNSKSKIYVGEDSNVSSTGIDFGIGIDYGTIEIHSGTFKGEKAVYCGGNKYGGHFETIISGSNTHLIGKNNIFHAFSSAQLTVTPEVDIVKENGGAEISYQGGGATFNIPENYTIHNLAGGSYTRNTTE